MNPRVLVVGLGRPRFGDDALGLVIAGRLRERLEHVASVTSHTATGWEALAAIQDEELLVLIDAAEENQRLPAGHWCRLDDPGAAGAILDCRPRTTHTLSLDSMLRMGQTLSRLPADVWVYLLAGRHFQPASGLSTSVDAAFRPQPPPRRAAERRKDFSEPVHGIRIINRNGHKVQLLAAPGLLRRNSGLGWEIRQRLAERAYPIVTTPGDADVTPAAVLSAAGTYDRVMVLLAHDTGRLPGSLVRDAKAEYVAASRENAGRVTTLVVQPDPAAGDSLGSTSGPLLRLPNTSWRKWLPTSGASHLN